MEMGKVRIGNSALDSVFWLISGSLALCLPSSRATGQSQFEVTLQQFAADEVRGYVQPMADMFGANLNAGLYHSAEVPEDGFHLRLEVVGVASLVQERHRTYDAVLPEGFTPGDGSFQTATVFGGTGKTFKDANSGLEYKGSDGVFNVSLFPLLVPQLTIGTLYGTEATLRYISTPPFSGGKLPRSTLWGIGIRHSISRYFSSLPVNAAVGVFYSSFKVGDILHVTGTVIDLQASRSFLILSVHGGIAFGSSSTTIRYRHESTGEPSSAIVDLTLDGNSRFRFTTGLQLDLQAIRLFADVNFGFINHFTGGIGLGF